MPSQSEVLPIETLLRNAWNTNRYMLGSVETKQPFLVEECSTAHLQRIRDLMADDYSWACIALVAMLSSEADLIGSWSEACPCHPLEYETGRSRSRTNSAAKKEAKQCPFRSCRAPELAAGKGIQLLCERMSGHRGPFLEYAHKAPEAKRHELISSWRAACSKLFGF